MNQFMQKKSLELNTKYNEVKLDNDSYINRNESFIIHKKLPIYSNEIPIYLLSKMKLKITVALSGEGADEFFGGYGTLKSYYDFKFLNIQKTFKDYFEKYDYVSKEIIKILGVDVSWRNERDKYFNNLDSKSNKNMVLEYFQKHLEGLLSR